MTTLQRWFVALFAVLLSLLGLAPVAAAEEAAAGYSLGGLRVTRAADHFTVSSCVDGVSLAGRTAAEIPHEARLYANDVLVRSDVDVLERHLPAIDGYPASDPCGRSALVWFSVRLSLDELAQSGIVEPSSATWEYFDLRVVLDVDDQQIETQRPMAIGGGPVQTAFNGAVPTPDGVRLEGWIMDPGAAANRRFMVTVDGRVFPHGDTIVPTEPAHVYARHAPITPVVDADWQAAGLGTTHGIGILVPFGEICVSRLIDASLPASEGFEPMGCRTTVPGEVSGSIDTVAPHATGARIRGNLYNPWVGSDQPWPHVFLVPDKGPTLMVTSGTRRAGLPPQFGEVTGWFDFEVNMPLPPGRRTVCMRELGEHSPPMWWPWATSPHEAEILHCRVVQVPHAPVGAAEVIVEGRRVTVKGWAVDLNGGAPRILVSVNGALRALTRTSEPNAYIQRTVGGDGRAGFTVRLDLPPGTHRVCTAWEDTSGGGWSRPTCDDAVVK